MKIALVHDDFTQLGGAERLFEEIAKIYPNAPIYTSVINYDKLPKSIEPKRTIFSFMQKLPFTRKFYKLLLPFYPIAFEYFNFDDYDLVISSTTRFAKSIVTKPRTIHICYINSVPRFLYRQNQNKDHLPPPFQTILNPYLKWLKRWDITSSQRVDRYIANSENVKEKVETFYSRRAEVIYPSVDTQFFKPNNSNQSSQKSYYLIVTRLVKWKQVEIAIKAAQDLNQNLIIVGDGPDKPRLKHLTDDKTKFTNNVSKEELRSLYRGAKALIVTQEEDFGIAAVEAQASGTSVIAYKSGGILETVNEGKTAVFFKEQTVKSLKDAISVHSKLKWNPEVCRASAIRFSKEAFAKNLKQTIDNACKFQRS